MTSTTGTGEHATSALPSLHNDWLLRLTGIDAPPSEPKATCGDCVMCSGPERSGSAVAFSPHVKCCNYVPHLANFIVGRSLLGPGRESIQGRIARRAGVTPLGLGLSQTDIRRIVAARSQLGEPDVVCPHFDDTNGCAIWQTRNAVCSTWFCQHERGAVSQRFWHATRDLLIATEERVAYHCLLAADLPEEQVHAVLGQRATVRETIALANAGENLSSDPSPDDESAAWYERMWGEWRDREEEWFLRCAESVENLHERELVAPMDELRELADAVGQRRRELSAHETPDMLMFSPGVGSNATGDELRLVGYSPFDPLVVPAAMLAPLQRLDGRPIAQVRAELSARGITLDDQILRQLYDFGIAVPPP